MLKAITLYEPFASLISIGAKINETRGQRTNHRGDICIHAALKDYAVSEEIIPATIKAFRDRGIMPQLEWKGCILAVVDLWEVRPSADFITCENVRPQFVTISEEEKNFGNYNPNRWIYRTRNLRRLKTPIPCKGFQCVGWTVPPEIEKLVRAQL
jgi:hypothetical protein